MRSSRSQRSRRRVTTPPSTGSPVQPGDVTNAAEMVAAFNNAANEGQTVALRGSSGGVDYGSVSLTANRASTVTFQVKAGERVTLSPTISGSNIAIRGAHFGSAPTIQSTASDVLIEYCTWSGSSQLTLDYPASGIVGAQRVTIRYCDVSSPTANNDAFIFVRAGDNITVEQNYFHDLAYDGGSPHSDVIQVNAQNASVQSMQVTNLTFRKNYIENNHGHTATIKDFGTNVGLVTFEENVISTVDSAFSGLPWYFYIGSVVFRRNVCWFPNTMSVGFYAGIKSPLVYEGNVQAMVYPFDEAANTTDPNIINTAVAATGGSRKDNLYSSASWAYSATTNNDKVLNETTYAQNSTSLFTDPANGDFRLKSTAPNFGLAGPTWKKGDWAYGPSGVGAL